MKDSKEGSDFIFFSSFGTFLLTGIYSKVRIWLLSLIRLAVFVSFLHSLSLLLQPILFFGYLGLCFRKQVDLLVLWFAQAPICMTSKQATKFIFISSWAYLVNNAIPSLPLLAHMEGMMVLFFLSLYFGNKYLHCVLLPASPWVYQSCYQR